MSNNSVDTAVTAVTPKKSTTAPKAKLPPDPKIKQAIEARMAAKLKFADAKVRLRDLTKNVSTADKALKAAAKQTAAAAKVLAAADLTFASAPGNMPKDRKAELKAVATAAKTAWKNYATAEKQAQKDLINADKAVEKQTTVVAAAEAAYNKLLPPAL